MSTVTNGGLPLSEIDSLSTNIVIKDEEKHLAHPVWIKPNTDDFEPDQATVHSNVQIETVKKWC